MKLLSVIEIEAGQLLSTRSIFINPLLRTVKIFLLIPKMKANQSSQANE